MVPCGYLQILVQFQNGSLWNQGGSVQIQNDVRMINNGSLSVGPYTYSDETNTLLVTGASYLFSILDSNSNTLFSYLGTYFAGRSFTFTLQERLVLCYRLNDSAQIPCFKTFVDASVNNTAF